MSTSSSAVSAGPGLSSMLTVLFVGLKLTGFIAWSWLWVLSPIWISLALILVFMCVVGLIAVVVTK